MCSHFTFLAFMLINFLYVVPPRCRLVLPVSLNTIFSAKAMAVICEPIVEPFLMMSSSNQLNETKIPSLYTKVERRKSIEITVTTGIEIIDWRWAVKLKVSFEFLDLYCLDFAKCSLESYFQMFIGVHIISPTCGIPTANTLVKVQAIKNAIIELYYTNYSPWTICT